MNERVHREWDATPTHPMPYVRTYTTVRLHYHMPTHPYVCWSRSATPNKE